MNNHQRGIYQPLAENSPVYDLSDDDGEEEEERSRLPLMIVIALVVLAAFTGVVWLAYNQGVARGRTGNTVVINAPEGPVRVAPGDSKGGAAFTGLKIYNQPVPPDQEAAASSLAPEPARVASAAPPPAAAPRPTSEAPQVRLDPGPPAPPPRPAALAARPAPAAPPPPAIAQAAPPPATPAARPAAAVPPPAAPPPAPARPAVAQATPAPAAAPTPPPAARPAPAAAAPPAVAATRASGASVAVSGGAVLQIGAFENPALAEGAWKTFKARHPDVVGDLSEDIQKADLGARGTFYRLRAGPFKDRPAAVAACEKLKTQGATCLVTAP